MKYSHENWNQVLDLPEGPAKELDLLLIGLMAKGNFQWFVRRCLGRPEDVRLGRAAGQHAIPKTDFLRRTEHETNISKD